MDSSSFVAPVAGQSGGKSRQAVRSHHATVEMAAQAVMKEGATKNQRYKVLVHMDRRQAPKAHARPSRRYDVSEQQQEVRQPCGMSVEEFEDELSRGDWYLATSKPNAQPAVARKAPAPKPALSKKAPGKTPAGDTTATIHVVPMAKVTTITTKSDETDNETMPPAADKIVPTNQEGKAPEAVGESTPAAGEAAAAPASGSATPTPRSSTAGLAAPLQRTLSAVKRFPSKVGRAADAAADAIIAAGRDVLAAADRLGDRLRASSSKVVIQLDASLEGAKVVVKDGSSKAAKVGKACLKKLGKLHRGFKKAMVCGSGSLPVEPVAVRV